MTDPTGYTPPIRPSGSNSLEARIKALEVAQGYDARELSALWQEIDQTHKVVHAEAAEARAMVVALRASIETLQAKAAVWVISALLAAVASLVLIVVKLKAPWLVP